jgi:hypothetical protein
MSSSSEDVNSGPVKILSIQPNNASLPSNAREAISWYGVASSPCENEGARLAGKQRKVIDQARQRSEMGELSS